MQGRVYHTRLSFQHFELFSSLLYHFDFFDCVCDKALARLSVSSPVCRGGYPETLQEVTPTHLQISSTITELNRRGRDCIGDSSERRAICRLRVNCLKFATDPFLIYLSKRKAAKLSVYRE